MKYNTLIVGFGTAEFNDCFCDGSGADTRDMVPKDLCRHLISIFETIVVLFELTECFQF